MYGGKPTAQGQNPHPPGTVKKAGPESRRRKASMSQPEQLEFEFMKELETKPTAYQLDQAAVTYVWGLGTVNPETTTHTTKGNSE